MVIVIGTEIDVRVQILNEATCISLNAYSFKKPRIRLLFP